MEEDAANQQLQVKDVAEGNHVHNHDCGDVSLDPPPGVSGNGSPSVHNVPDVNNSIKASLTRTAIMAGTFPRCWQGELPIIGPNTPSGGGTDDNTSGPNTRAQSSEP